MTATVPVAAPRESPPSGPVPRAWVLRTPVRVAFALFVAGLFLASYTQPLWVTRFTAPQYPYGLTLKVYVDRVAGDTQEVDLLNHYVGLRPIAKMAPLERSVSFAVLVIVSLLAVQAAVMRRPLWQILFLVPLLLFPVVALVDLHAWLWYAGHSLDPESPLASSVKPFTPKLIGSQQIANFEVTSGLGAGIYLQLAGALLLAGAAALGWKLSKKNAP